MSTVKEYKVVLVGESGNLQTLFNSIQKGVGKSSIIYRFVNQDFKDSIDPTIGATFITKSLKLQDREIKFSIWDTAGQEKFHSLASLYYEGFFQCIKKYYFCLDSSVAIIVYDITSAASFQVLKNWIDEIQEKGPKDIVIAIAGNKCDLVEKEEVGYDEAFKYAKSQNAIFKLTSAKENQGISELFTAIASKLENTNLSLNQNKPQAQQLKHPNAAKAQKDQQKSGCC